MAHSLPDFDQEISLYDVESGAAMVQRGFYKKPSFYGDSSYSPFHSLFKSGISAASKFSTSRNNKKTVKERKSGEAYALTDYEYSILVKRASSISSFTKIPYDTCEDFLVILCHVDNIDDMKIIAEATQLPELDNPNIIKQPLLILNLPNLEKISFLAQAIDGIVNMFRRFSNAAVIVENDSEEESTNSILGAISSMLSGFGGIGSITTRIETNMVGNFLSELITGNRIPTNVIAKNPNLQSPSYAGKVFFGESPNALSNIDVDQLLAKPIAVFPKPSSGSGSTSFGMQNFGSFQQTMPLQNFVSKFMTGSPKISSPRKENIVNNMVEKITTFTGARNDEDVEIYRADNALPIQMAIATAFSGYDKLIFPTKSFTEGWTESQSVSAISYESNKSFFEMARNFL